MANKKRTLEIRKRRRRQASKKQDEGLRKSVQRECGRRKIRWVNPADA